MTEEEMRLGAIEFAKKSKIAIAKELTDPLVFAPDQAPISVFMAGSPGAGKTEFSKNLIELLEKNKERRVVRIDGDEIRPRIPGYAGNNSYLFQGAIALVVEKMHDLVLHRNQSFVLDSTFAKYGKALDNVRRSLEHKRPTFIFFVYQKPEVAWKFTQAREKEEGRNIPKSAFVEEFIGAQETVSRIQKEYGERVDIFFVKKDFEKNTVGEIIEIGLNNTIDHQIQKVYTIEELNQLL